MNDTSGNDAVTLARRHCDSHRYREALAALERAAVDAAPVRLARAEAYFGMERFHAAHGLCGDVVGGKGVAAGDRVRARVLDARVLLRSSPLCDDALEHAALAVAEAARLEDALPDDRRALAVEARIVAVQGYTRKRCRKLAERELAAARAALADGGGGRMLAAEGRLLLAFDERGPARERFAAAVEAGGAGRRLGLLGLAQIDTLMGEFDRAHGHLDALGAVAPEDLAPRRSRERLLAAQARWSDVAALLGAMIAASPEADGVQCDRYDRAAALYRAGRTAEAVEAWRELAAPPAPRAGDRGGDGKPREGYWQRRARRNAELLARPPAGEGEGAPGRRRKRLATFPSVAQLRNHCGPAAVELYLRFFGVPAAQMEVARAIKDPEGGTPVYRMRRFLEAAGFATRRIEADLPELRRLIDAGIPVIMEEDYSETRHVAVAIGYDDERELLEVQDPMSHDVRETYYEDLPALRNLSNHGALVGVPRAEEARLDAAGAAECRYIAAIDEAWAAKDGGKADEADRLADESVALQRDYELAWMFRFYRARDLADAAGGAGTTTTTAPAAAPAPDARQRLRDIVAEVVKLWPDDEWPQQLAGEVLYVDRRWDEALRAFEKARDRDPDDARNWSMIADCHLATGRDDAAHEALGQALRRDPGHRRANENQAYQYHRLGRTALAEIANDVARELGPKNPYNHGVHALLLAQAGDLEGAVAAYTRALDLEPGRIGYLVDRARLEARLGRVDNAVAALERAARERPSDVGLRVDFADLLYAYGRAEAAIAVCRELRALDAKHPSSYAIGGAALCAAGRLDEGLGELREALARRPTYAWVLDEMGKHLGKAGRHVDAVQAHAAALGLSGSAMHELHLGDALERAGFPADGARRARSAASSGRLSADDMTRAAEILFAGEGVNPTHAFLEGLEKKDPRNVGLLRAHAGILLEKVWGPGLAREVLEKLRAVAPQDPFALASRGGTLLDGSLADEAEGERLLREAISRAPALAYPRRQLAQRLGERGRFADVLSVLEGMASDYMNDNERAKALLGLERVADAEATVAAFEAARRPQGGAPPVGALMMRYRIARHRGDLAAALALSESISREHREDEGDGRLDPWEEEKFECLVGLGELDRARRFGEQQAGDAASAGRLALAALAGGAPALAVDFAARAAKLNGDEPGALSVRARLAELGGDGAEAARLWTRMSEVSGWHASHEELARLRLGEGDADVDGALVEVDKALAAGGHTCPWPFAVRAQARVLRGDRDGARADLERAWALARPASSRRRHPDVWWLRARLAGDGAAASALLAEAMGERSLLSAADRARVGRVREALVRSPLPSAGEG